MPIPESIVFVGGNKEAGHSIFKENRLDKPHLAQIIIHAKLTKWLFPNFMEQVVLILFPELKLERLDITFLRVIPG